jgi:2-dehydro-3-deoxygluconokinase
MHYYRTGSAAAGMVLGDVAGWVSSPVWFHVTGVLAALSPGCYDLVDQLLDHASAGGRRVSFDVNFRPALWPGEDSAPRLLSLARRADTVFVGRDEAAALWDVEDIEEIRRLLPDVRRLVVKDGGVAAYSFGEGRVVRTPALRVPVLEPVGAGDAFAAGYLAAQLRSRSEGTALRWGHLLAAQALTTVADQVQPPPAEVLTAAARLSEGEWASGAILCHPHFARSPDLRGSSVPS